jgi:hypothetical protein
MPLAQASSNLQGSQDRPPRLVFMGERRPEQGHKAVTQELIDRPLVAVDLDQGQLEKPVQEGVHGFGTHALSQDREVRQVAEKDGDLFALALEGASGGQDLLGEVLRGVGLRGVESLS